jgi:polysaccharide export outer membrane protein
MTVPSSEKFNVGDLVVVNFSGLSDVMIPPHEERVKEDGTITLPFIGSVVARGKGPGELQKEIRAKYVEGKIYPANLNVTVKGQERSFFVDGEVRMPNRYVWAEGMTVLKAVASAGGFTDFAKRSKVTVTRMDGRKFTINCEKAMENPELDLPVYPGDRVLVPRRWI